jgi:hypothetical protein
MASRDRKLAGEFLAKLKNENRANLRVIVNPDIVIGHGP